MNPQQDFGFGGGCEVGLGTRHSPLAQAASTRRNWALATRFLATSEWELTYSTHRRPLNRRAASTRRNWALATRFLATSEWELAYSTRRRPLNRRVADATEAGNSPLATGLGLLGAITSYIAITRGGVTTCPRLPDPPDPHSIANSDFIGNISDNLTASERSRFPSQKEWPLDDLFKRHHMAILLSLGDMSSGGRLTKSAPLNYSCTTNLHVVFCHVEHYHHAISLSLAVANQLHRFVDCIALTTISSGIAITSVRSRKLCPERVDNTLAMSLAKLSLDAARNNSNCSLESWDDGRGLGQCPSGREMEEGGPELLPMVGGDGRQNLGGTVRNMRWFPN
ncbi:hypothetical protein KSP40_PGU000748 [Platanthera guangdongensis]|uniref:Uncharacterized protein n=1 Tax=Platanthera guangdongensis TaxID=2320717 RepID=A0ABR2LIR3_9ASPA